MAKYKETFYLDIFAWLCLMRSFSFPVEIEIVKIQESSMMISTIALFLYFCLTSWWLKVVDQIFKSIALIVLNKQKEPDGRCII